MARVEAKINRAASLLRASVDRSNHQWRSIPLMASVDAKINSVASLLMASVEAKTNSTASLLNLADIER